MSEPRSRPSGSRRRSKKSLSDGRKLFSVNWLLPYTFLCTIGPSVTAATSLFVVRQLMCRYHSQQHTSQSILSTYSSDKDGDVCNDPTVEALTSSVMAGLAILDGIMSFLSTSYVQRLADRYGRRPLLIALPLIATISTLSMMIAYSWATPTLAWILLAANGIFVAAGTKSIFIPGLCVADIADTAERTRFYSRLEAVALLGPGTAYVTSALISRYIPLVLFPYYVALGSQLLASIYAALAISETLAKTPPTAESESEDEDQDEEEEADGFGEVVEQVVDNLVAPVRPLSLLLPHKDENGKVQWKLFFLALALFFTTTGTVFIATASLLYLSDKFAFNPENNAWVLAYLTFSRFAYLIIVFPFVLSYGRRAYHWYESRKSHGERERLLNGSEDGQGKENSAGGETNHFDVILAFLSVALDAVSLVLVSLAQTYRQVLGSFSILALGAGDNPTFKSVFVSAVPKEHASEALTALDMILSAAKLSSPLILGSVYAAFVKVGQPEMLFLVAGAFCLGGAALLGPLVLTGRK